MKKINLILLYIIFLGIFSNSYSQNNPAKIYIFSIDENISKPALRKTEKAIKEANELKSDIILLNLNTFGGELESADKIRTLLLESKIPVFVRIDKNAASAGALISIACDSIYMASGASIGAASVVNKTGEIMPDKYQSYMRALMRSTAENNGRNPLIAEAMVDPDTYIEGISDSGKVLTFTTNEAIKHGYCENEANSNEEVFKVAGIKSYIINEQKLTWIDKLISFLINPAVSGILIMFIIGGIYFELQSPGIGFALIVAIVAALLFFAPHYLEGLATHWEILLFILGVGLLILEIFVTPGFGVAGISGIVLVVAALILTMVFNIGFNFKLSPPNSIVYNFLIVITASILGFFLALFLGKKLLTSETRYGHLFLKTSLTNEQGFISQDMSITNVVGMEGITLTFMRPVGKIEVNGEIYDATSEFGLIDKNEKVLVTKFENSQLFVQKI